MRFDWMMVSDGPEGGTEGLFSRDLGQERRGSWKQRAVVLGVLTLLALGLWLWLQGSKGRALAALSPVQRRALFQETWADHRTLCQSDAGAGFEARCRQQAEFLQRFPECDEPCRAELKPWLPHEER